MEEIQDLHLDWLRGTILWLENSRLIVMSVTGGRATELLQLAGEVIGNIAFDLKANSLLWNSKLSGWWEPVHQNVKIQLQVDVSLGIWSQCGAFMIRILYRFYDFEFAAGAKPPWW